MLVRVIATGRPDTGAVIDLPMHHARRLIADGIVESLNADEDTTAQVVEHATPLEDEKVETAVPAPRRRRRGHNRKVRRESHANDSADR